MSIVIQALLLFMTTIYQAIACKLEDRKPPLGKRYDVGGYHLHLYVKGEKNPTIPTIILDHSLGGVEGYLLIEALAKLGQVCIYDRAGYGWSDRSPHARTSDRIVTELDVLLTQAGIVPPYILIGDSFGSYNVRLYAHRFPEKVKGLVLTDGVHEVGMLNMPLSLKALKLFFVAGFVMSIFGSALGIIRLLKTGKVFEGLKPELRKLPKDALNPVKRSFCRPKHWMTMSQEMLSLDASAHQVSAANQFGAMPMVSIQANSFFQPSFWTALIPLQSANRLREKMHLELLKLSTDCVHLQADKSGHFVWVDRPDIMIDAVKIVLEKVDPVRSHSVGELSEKLE
ncbi:Alpha/beta hydrolase fold protein [Tumidithrix helvetica PCC 7403]|uniref:alpha/beta fold hydrolase n=1 Tax=Tumidithrix helvetica TaxID=3457545 RepID=UPI003C8C12B4